MYISALLGMELYAHRVKFDYEGNIVTPETPHSISPRSNFDNLS